MGIPIPFLLALLIPIAHFEVASTLPGEATATRLLPWLPLLAAPWTSAVLLGWHVESRLRAGATPARPTMVWIRLQPYLVPLCYGAIVHEGLFVEWVAAALPDSMLLQFAVLCAPLLAMELSFRRGARRTERWLEHLGAGSSISPLAMTPLVLAPFLLLMVCADLVALDRRAWVFFHQTAIGTTVGLLGVIAMLCVALPLCFRYLIPVTSELPASLADDIRETAAKLGFPARAVVKLRTGYRMINAAMVGPVRWPRYLVLTDGLLAYLEPAALKGVVAHEIGHARADHPSWLVLVFAVVPVLLFEPALHLEPETVSGPFVLAGLGVFAVVVILLLRGLAHRFEYEADQLSAEALGDPAFCVSALSRVGALSTHGSRRSSFRHPSEKQRIRNLQACHDDPAFRRRFWARGRWVRGAILGVTAAAAAVSVVGHASLWSLDRATYEFYNGRFEAAGSALASETQATGERGEIVDEIRRRIAAARALGFASVEWHDVGTVVAPRAREDALRRLQEGADLDDVEPTLALALTAPDNEPWLETLYLYCATTQLDAAEGAAERRRLAAHLYRIASPEWVRQLVRQ